MSTIEQQIGEQSGATDIVAQNTGNVRPRHSAIENTADRPVAVHSRATPEEIVAEVMTTAST